MDTAVAALAHDKMEYVVYGANFIQHECFQRPEAKKEVTLTSARFSNLEHLGQGRPALLPFPLVPLKVPVTHLPESLHSFW